MTTRVYLIRHGEPEIEDGKTFYGATDLPLSEKGARMAAELAPVIDRISPDLILSSPMERCLATAEKAEVDPLVVSELREMDLGNWEMMSFADVARNFPTEFERRWDDIENFRPPGGESFQDLAERTNRALRDNLDGARSVAIFGHLGAFRSILWKELGLPLKVTFSMEQDYCGIHVLDYGQNATKLVKSNWSAKILGSDFI